LNVLSWLSWHALMPRTPEECCTPWLAAVVMAWACVSTPDEICMVRLAGPAVDPVRHLLRAVATDVASDYAAAALECANAAGAVEERT